MTNNKQQTAVEFVPYELALELKQLGFDEPCLATIDQTDFIHIKGTEYPIRGAMIYDTIDCPTYSQAFRWFREKHNIHTWIINAEDNHNVFKPFFRGTNIHDQHLVDFYKTYEEAELACLRNLIEIVKTYGGGEQ
jgi:hypothetical protein